MADLEIKLNKTIPNLEYYTNVPDPTDLLYTVVFKNNNPISYRITLDSIAQGIKHNCLSADFAFIPPTTTTLSTFSAKWNAINTQNFSECMVKWKDALTIFNTLSASWLEQKDIRPISSIFVSTTSTNPCTYFPETTWQRISQDKTLIGVGIGCDGTNPPVTVNVNTSHGAAAVELCGQNIPAHCHGTQYYSFDSSKQVKSVNGSTRFYSTDYGTGALIGSPKTTKTGSNNSHNNMQPFIVVNIWKRLT